LMVRPDGCPCHERADWRCGKFDASTWCPSQEHNFMS
jgi:hypothetical protein